MCCAQTAAPEGKKAERWSMRTRGYCANKSIMCQSASIVSRRFCRGCRHVARKAVQLPTTRSVAARNNKARGTAKGMSKHNPKAFQQPVQHVPRPSKIEVLEVLGKQNSPRRRPRQGKGGPRAAKKDPRAAKRARETFKSGQKPA